MLRGPRKKVLLLVLLCALLSCQREADRQNSSFNQQPAEPTPVPSPSSPVDHTNRTDRPFRAQFADRLWETSLGKLYRAFLLSTIDREEIPIRARQIAERLYSDTDQTVARIKALQILNEDLYVKGKVDEDIVIRISLLEQKMTDGRQKVESSTVKMILGQIPFVFLASLPTGSPLVRSETKKFFRGYGARVVAWVKWVKAPPGPDMQWRRLASKDVFHNYELGKPIETFSRTAIPLTMTEWVYSEQKIGGSGEDLSQFEIEKAANF